MHYSVIVFGEDVEEQLEPYCEEYVSPKWEAGDSLMLANILDAYGTEPEADDLTEFAQMSGYADATISEGRLYLGNLHNPDGRWDWWVVGGRWAGALVQHDGEKVDRTTVGQVRWDESLAARTAVVLHESRWHELGRGEDTAESVQERLEMMLEIALALPPETPVTIVDCHV